MKKHIRGRNMKTGKRSGILYRLPILLITLIFCISFATHARVSDAWDASGKLVIEGADWTAVFSREEGALLIRSGTKETIRIVPFSSEKAQQILSCEVTQNKSENTTVETSFSTGESQIEGSFFFDREGTIEIAPGQNMEGILVSGEISFGVVPAPPMEDLIYDPGEYPAAAQINLPSENLFFGLLSGEDSVFYCAWPEGLQKVKLLLKEVEGSGKAIEALELRLDGKSAYLKSVNVPGIWHKETLLRTYLGKDVKTDWRRPFPAKWKTQLMEGDIETSFPFKTRKDRIWRPNFGFYDYPVWFDGDRAFFHPSKRIPPSEQVLIYALEEHEDTPIQFARRHLGSISTLKQKECPQRYPSDNVGIQNCDGRAWVKWIFKMNLQTREREFLQEVMDDFIYSINVDKSRLAEYEVFIPQLKEKIGLWMQEEKGDPELQPFLGRMKERVEELEREYWSRMHDSPVSDHLQEETEVINRLRILVEEDGVEIYPEVVHLLDRIQLWSDIESVPGRVGGLIRDMSQQAGYDCANNASLVKYAQQIRRDIREFVIAGETHETIY